MKKFIIVLLAINSYFIYSQEKDYYPIKPGTVEWGKLKTEEERYAALQVPENITKNSNTKELIKICLDYPAFGHYTAFINQQKGFERTLGNFNALQELLNRKDAGDELLLIYDKMDTIGFNNPRLNCNEKYWTIKFAFIELIIAQEKIINHLSDTNKNQFLILCKEKIKMKEQSNAFASLYNIQTTAFLMVRIIKDIDNNVFREFADKNKNIEFFYNNCILNDFETLNSVILLCNSYLTKSNKM